MMTHQPAHCSGTNTTCQLLTHDSSQQPSDMPALPAQIVETATRPPTTGEEIAASLVFLFIFLVGLVLNLLPFVLIALFIVWIIRLAKAAPTPTLEPGHQVSPAALRADRENQYQYQHQRRGEYDEFEGAEEDERFGPYYAQRQRRERRERMAREGVARRQNAHPCHAESAEPSARPKAAPARLLIPPTPPPPPPYSSDPEYQQRHGLSPVSPLRDYGATRSK